MAEISEKTQQIINVLEQNIEILTKELDLGMAYLSQMKTGAIVHNNPTQQEKEIESIVKDLQSKAQRFIDKLSGSNSSTSETKTTTKTETIAKDSNIEQNLKRHHEEDESTLDMLERMQRKIIAQEQLSGIYREYHKPDMEKTSKTNVKQKIDEAEAEVSELEEEIDRLKLFDKLSDLKSKMGYD